MACYPWIVPWTRQLQNLDDFANLRRWFDAIRDRPATLRAYEKGQPLSERPVVAEEGKKILFGQTARHLSRPDCALDVRRLVLEAAERAHRVSTPTLRGGSSPSARGAPAPPG